MPAMCISVSRESVSRACHVHHNVIVCIRACPWRHLIAPTYCTHGSHSTFHAPRRQQAEVSYHAITPQFFCITEIFFGNIKPGATLRTEISDAQSLKRRLSLLTT